MFAKVWALRARPTHQKVNFSPVSTFFRHSSLNAMTLIGRYLPRDEVEVCSRIILTLLKCRHGNGLLLTARLNTRKFAYFKSFPRRKQLGWAPRYMKRPKRILIWRLLLSLMDLTVGWRPGLPPTWKFPENVEKPKFLFKFSGIFMEKPWKFETRVKAKTC